MILNIWVKKMNKNKLKKFAIILLFIIIMAKGEYCNNEEGNQAVNIVEDTQISYNIENIPEYSGEIYVEINNNMPEFSIEDMNLEKDYYSDLNDGRVRNGNDQLSHLDLCRNSMMQILF